jgi:twitching motility two-component system response regulator PilG
MSISAPAQLVSLQAAIAAAKNGRKEKARELLLELTQLDSNNEVAWLWLATLAEDIEEATRHITRVLRINPHNEHAQAWMSKLQSPKGQASPLPTSIATDPAPTNLKSLSSINNEASTHSFDRKHVAKPADAHTILVVDDSPTICKLVSLTLEKYGHQVVCANNGLDALGKLKEVVPDLILSDITMPHMDGYQLCKMIRSNVVTKGVPIIMLSGKDGIFDKLRGRMVGATAYITKPFEIESLLQLIEMHCQQASQSI